MTIRVIATINAFMFVCILKAAQPSANIERTTVVTGEGYFPVALRLQDGRIAIVLRGGGPHLSIHGRLDIVFSSDEGKSWTRPAVVASDPAADVRNPAFGQADDGTLVVAYYRTMRYDEQGRYNNANDKPVNTWVTRSSDGGKTWSTPSQIDVSDIGWASPFGRIITRTDGTMLTQLYGGPIRVPEKTAAKVSYSYLYRSTDQGKTWSRYSTISPEGFDETGLIVLRSGRFLAGLRSSGRKANLWLSHSDDTGKTWSAPAPLSPPGVYTADFLVLPDQRVLLVANDRIGPFGVYAVVGTKDGEFNWKDAFVLSDDAINGDCGYPSSVLLKDRRVLTVYYATGSKRSPGLGIHCAALTYRPSPVPDP